MDAGVTRLAQAHQIALVMRTAFRQRNDVVYHFDRSDDPVTVTFLTVRELLHMDAPCYSPLLTLVPSFHFRVSAEAFVVLIDLLHMLRTV